MWDETELALLSAARDNPLDVPVKQVYADWLEERGDRRGEFLRALSLHLSDPASAGPRKRVNELRGGIDPVWLAAVGDTEARLRAAAEALDEQEGAGHFEYVKALCNGDPSFLPLRCTDSSIGVHRAGFLLDLEVSVDATDPHTSATDEEELRQLIDGEVELRAFIGSREVAPAIRSLYLWAAGGANGTAHINLDPYVNGTGEFVNLKRFATNFYNECGQCIICSAVIGNGYDEAGLLAILLGKSPVIEDLELPSAPGSSFFDVGVRPLRRLRIDAGFDHQRFILNLSRADCFPYLQDLHYSETALSGDESPERATPFSHFVDLFRSRALARVPAVTLSSVRLTEDEVRQLQSIRSEGVTIHQDRRR